MKIHRGRLVDHIHLRTRDLDAAKRFYRAALQSVGRGDAIHEDETHFQADELWIEAVYHGPMKASAESVVITPAGEGA